MCHPALLLLAKKPPDGGLDALLLRLLVERVLAARHAAQGAGLGLQRRPHPEDTSHFQRPRAREARRSSPRSRPGGPYPRASLCEEAGSVCVIRTLRGVAGGDVSHLMVALSSRPSSSTAAICGNEGQKKERGGVERDPRTPVDLCVSVSLKRVPSSCASSDHWAVGQRKETAEAGKTHVPIVVMKERPFLLHTAR